MHLHTPRTHRGFSLIEAMVALAIGMATVVIMLQMLSNADAAKRTTGSGNDAQMNGALALFSLTRDVQASGYGINAFKLLGCDLTYTTSGDTTSVTIPLAPITITPPTSQGPVPAGDANTDTLLVVYGNGTGSAEGDPLVSNATSGSYPVSTTSSFQAGDTVIAQASVRPTTCNLKTDKVTSVPTAGTSISVSPGVSGLASGSIIYNLGSAPVVRAYAVRNGNLTVCDFTVYNCGNSSYTSKANVWVPIANNIVALRAQYGRDDTDLASAMKGVVSSYNQITPASTADKSGLSPFCSWARTLSVRMAVVARSSAVDKAMPTAAAPTWAGSTVTTTSPSNPTAVTFNLTNPSNSADDTWKKYRYKTLETTVPLRNAIWQGGQATYQGGSGC
jgi:type IV pilus assembly protein PilW